MRQFKTAALLGIGLAFTATQTKADLVAHWEFEDGSGTTAVDSAGGDNDGTLTGGPTFVTGTIGGGLDFDGTDDRLTAPLTGIPTGDAARTISLWVNTDNNSNQGQFMAYGDGSGATGGGGADSDPLGDWFQLSIEDSGLLYFRYSGGNNRYNLSGDTNLAINTWYHVAIVVPDIADPQTDDVLVFLNGTLANTTLTGTVQDLFTDPSAAVPDFYLGNNNQGTNWFDGTLDDVQVYDEALSATDIASLYNNPGSVIPEPGSLALLGLGGLCVLRRRRD